MTSKERVLNAISRKPVDKAGTRAENRGEQRHKGTEIENIEHFFGSLPTTTLRASRLSIDSFKF